MRSAAILLLACSCGCSRPVERPSQKPEEVEVRAISDPGAQVPKTRASCATACAAAAAQTCERIAEQCGYEANGFVAIGASMLRCKAACAAACLGPATGVPMCVAQCSEGDGSAGAEAHRPP